MSENPAEPTENQSETHVTALPPLDAEKQAQVDALLSDLNARAKADGLGVEFTQDGDNVQGKDVATGEVIEVEPEPWYRCKKGHRVQGAWIHVARGIDGQPLAVSGPTCRVCWVEWMAQKFSAVECSPPKAKAS